MARFINIINNQVQDDRVTIAHPSARTAAERNKFAAQLDDFATFC